MTAIRSNPWQLSDTDRQTLREWLADFDRSWNENRLAERVRELPPPGSTLRLPILVEMVKIDLRRRWQRGLQVTVESYLMHYPELGTTDTVPIDLIEAEYQLRQETGVPASWSAFGRRFPGHAAEFRTRESQFRAQSSPTPGALWPTAPLAAHEQFGRYRILRRLGGGGMGTVYLAEDSQLGRQVALKVPHLGPDRSEEVLQRFDREARSAAGIQHPNICPVYDVGVVDGTPYLTMAYIEGRPLSEFVRDGLPLLTQPQAITVVCKLALAMGEAHARGVIHRDLKSSNVMINKHGEPIIMDFGLARRTDAGDPRLTRSGVLLGTPAYMAPEQVAGDLKTIGPRSDVYSLGVVLYELLTGQLPFRGSFETALVKVLTEPPTPPSGLRPGLDPRLDAICLKALAKMVQDRYPNMGALTVDLATYLKSVGPASGSLTSDTLLGDIPALPAAQVPIPGGTVGAGTLATSSLAGGATQVDAPPPHAGWRDKSAGRPRSRRRWLIAAGLLPLLAGAALLAYFIWKNQPPREQDEKSAGGPTPRDKKPAEKPAPADKKADDKSKQEDVAALQGIRITSRPPGATIFLEGKELSDRSGARLDVKPGKYHLKLMLAGFQPREEEIEVKSGKAVQVFDYPLKAIKPAKPLLKQLVNSLGMKLVLIPAGKFRMGSPRDEAGRGQDEDPPHTVEISRPFYLGVFEVTQDEYEKVTGQNPSYFSAAGRGKDAVAGLDNKGRLPVENVSWDDAVDFCRQLSAQDAEKRAGRVYRLPTEAEWEYACRAGGKAPDPFHFGRTLSSRQANFNGQFDAGDTAETGVGRTTPVGSYPANAFGLYDMHGNVMEWCADGYDKDYYSASPPKDPQGPADADQRVLRGGSWLAQGKYCRSASREALPPKRHAYTYGFRVVLNVPGTALPPVKPGLPPSRRWQAHTGYITAMAFSANGKRLASAGDLVVKVWTLPTGKMFRALEGHDKVVYGLAYAPQAERLASASNNERVIHIWNVEEGKEIFSWNAPQRGILALAFDPDGNRLASAGSDKALRIWNAHTGMLLVSVLSNSPIRCLAYSPNRKLIATGSVDGTVQLLDARNGQRVARWPGHTRMVRSLAFSPNSRYLVTGGFDKRVRLWDGATGKAIATLEHPGIVHGVAFSPDGERFATACDDKTVKLWITQTRKQSLILRYATVISHIAFAPDGKFLAAGGMKGAIWYRRLPEPKKIR